MEFKTRKELVKRVLKSKGLKFDLSSTEFIFNATDEEFDNELKKLNVLLKEGVAAVLELIEEEASHDV